MSQFKKNCTTCGKEIQLSNDSGKWKPLNLDNSPHKCLPGDRYTPKETGTKNVSNGKEMVSVPVADLKKMLEFIEGIEGIKHRLGIALGLGVEK